MLVGGLGSSKSNISEFYALPLVVESLEDMGKCLPLLSSGQFCLSYIENTVKRALEQILLGKNICERTITPVVSGLFSIMLLVV